MLQKKLSKLLFIRRVAGNSMIPALKDGQIIIASTLKPPSAGSIVVFRHENKEKIKRVKSISNDKIEVIGDNIGASTDSRDFGLIEIDYVIGTVLFNDCR